MFNTNVAALEGVSKWCYKQILWFAFETSFGLLMSLVINSRIRIKILKIETSQKTGQLWWTTLLWTPSGEIKSKLDFYYKISVENFKIQFFNSSLSRRWVAKHSIVQNTMMMTEKSSLESKTAIINPWIKDGQLDHKRSIRNKNGTCGSLWSWTLNF